MDRELTKSFYYLPLKLVLERLVTESLITRRYDTNIH